MSSAVLSLGSNLGDRLGHLKKAAQALGSVVTASSSVYETPPWGDSDQPAYFNAVLVVSQPGADAREWLRRAQSLEQAAGRVRDPARRYGPRSLDVDVITVWDDTGEPIRSEHPDLILPHPRAHQRAFVLVPWAEVEPDGVLPGHGPIVDLLQSPEVAPDVPEIVRVAPPL